MSDSVLLGEAPIVARVNASASGGKSRTANGGNGRTSELTSNSNSTSNSNNSSSSTLIDCALR